MEDPSATILELVRDALKLIEGAASPVSSIIRRCIRVARLRGDYLGHWWLEWELADLDDHESRRAAFRESISNLPKERFVFWQARYNERWKVERRVGTAPRNETEDFQLLPFSLLRIEADLDELRVEAASLPTTKVPSPLPGYPEISSQLRRESLREQIRNREIIVRRIIQRVHVFLIDTERALILASSAASVFERYRRDVDGELSQISPGALAALSASYAPIANGSPEALSQALTSCRRVLKALADAVYPAKHGVITSADGKVRKLDDPSYLNRLWQFIYEQSMNYSGNEIARVTVVSLGERLDAVNALANKGVHANVTEFDAYQCYIQTYLLVGDVLRLRT